MGEFLEGIGTKENESANGRFNFITKVLLSISSTSAFIFLILLLGTDIFSNSSISDYLFFGLLFCRLIELIFLTIKVIRSKIELVYKVAFLLVCFAIIPFTPIYVWLIHNKLIKKGI